MVYYYIIIYKLKSLLREVLIEPSQHFTLYTRYGYTIGKYIFFIILHGTIPNNLRRILVD